MKILVIKRDKIGDLLLTTPMLAHLRRHMPDAQIHLLVNDYNAWVVANNRDLDRIWVYRRVRTGRRVRIGAAFEAVWQMLALRREKFDIAIVANGFESDRAIKRAIATRARRIIAYVKDPALRRAVTDPLDEPYSQHESERLLAMLGGIGIPMPREPLYPSYLPPATSMAFALSWLRDKGITPGRYLVLGLGARRARKQPTKEQILRWSRHFKEQHGFDTVFMWTPGKSDNPLYPGDDEVAQPVLDAAIPYIHPFRGPIAEALGLIWNAAVSIFPDSGLMHFAAASPGGVLGLFADVSASPHPSQWGPRGPRADYLEAPKAVADLPDEIVFSRVEALLAGAKSAAGEARVA